MLHLFQENKSYGIETIVLILCLHVAVHYILNKKGYSELQWATMLGLISYIELHRWHRWALGK
jgi:hypothetical protein